MRADQRSGALAIDIEIADMEGLLGLADFLRIL